MKCNHTLHTEYTTLQQNFEKCCCQLCIRSNTPFSNSSNDIPNLINQGKSSSCFETLDTDNNINVEFFRDIESIDFSTETENDISNKCQYLSISELNARQTALNNQEFSLLHLNIASLRLHFDELTILKNGCNLQFDIIGISETGLKNSLEIQTLTS